MRRAAARLHDRLVRRPFDPDVTCTVSGEVLVQIAQHLRPHPVGVRGGRDIEAHAHRGPAGLHRLAVPDPGTSSTTLTRASDGNRTAPVDL